MNLWLKFLFIVLGGIGFFILSGSGSEALLLIVILTYLEFRFKKKE